MNHPVLAYQFASSEPETFAELSRVTLISSAVTDDDVEVPAGTTGTVVGVWLAGAAYEVDTPLGLATVDAAKLVAA